MAKENKKKGMVFGQRPNTFYYNIIGIGIVVPIAKLLFKFKIKKDKAVTTMEGPLVCVGTHPSYLDPIIMASLLRGRKINFVAGAFLFRNRFIAPLFAKGGCIPKVQFHSDSRAVKAMLTALNNKGTLGIFPEGTRFVDGTSIAFDDALARLIYRTKSAVAFMQTNGAYSTWPRWSTNGSRPGRIEARISLVLTAEEVQNLGVEGLHRLMLDQLAYNEYQWLKQSGYTYKSKAIAAGIHNIAYGCPRCHENNVMRSEKNRLYCVACGNQVLVDNSGLFHPVGEDDRCFEDLHLWTLWQRERVRLQVAKPDFVVKAKTRLLLPYGEFDFRVVGEGEVRISGGEVIYEGTQCPVEEGADYSRKRDKKKRIMPQISTAAPFVAKVFTISKLRGIGADYGIRFELIESGGQLNRFLLDDGQQVFEIQQTILAMKEAEAIF